MGQMTGRKDLRIRQSDCRRPDDDGVGVGVESSSHIFGLFQHICVFVYIITSDESVVHCGETEHRDLFRNNLLWHKTQS